MKRLNGILAMTALLLFVVHGVLGTLLMTNIAPILLKSLSHAFLAVVGVHVLISIGYTVHSLAVAHRTHAPYFKENRLFWSRRISGFVTAALMVFHFFAFIDHGSSTFRLVPFDMFRLITQLLLLSAVAVHIISNLKPLLISFGARKIKTNSGRLLFVLSAALLFMAAGFIIYYIRWQLNAV